MPHSGKRVRVGLVRAAAVYLALASAWVIAGVSRGEDARPFVPLFLRALAVTAPLQAVLFWSPTARGWKRLFAALLMVPSALLLGGLIGEVIERVVRGYPLKVLPTTTWVGGAAVYVWQFFFLAFPRKRPEGAREGVPERSSSP